MSIKEWTDKHNVVFSYSRILFIHKNWWSSDTQYNVDEPEKHDAKWNMSDTKGYIQCACSVAQSCPTLCNPMDCSPPGSSVHGIFQVRMLEWVAISFSRGSSRSRDSTHISCIGRWIRDHRDTTEALEDGTGHCQALGCSLSEVESPGRFWAKGGGSWWWEWLDSVYLLIIEPRGFADGLDMICETEWSRGTPGFWVWAPEHLEMEVKLGKDQVLGRAQMLACWTWNLSWLSRGPQEACSHPSVVVLRRM